MQGWAAAGVFNEPLADLMKVLASLVDNDNRILVPGFHDLVRPNTLEPALERLTASSEFSLDGYRAALGIPRLVRLHCAPSCFCPTPNTRGMRVLFSSGSSLQPGCMHAQLKAQST